jgi:hypothetical protein
VNYIERQLQLCLNKVQFMSMENVFVFVCFCSLEGERGRGWGGYFLCCLCFCFLFLFVYIFNNRILYLKSEVNLHNSHIDIVSETKFHGLIFYSKLHSLPELFFLVFTSTCHSFLSCIKWKTIHWFDLIWFDFLWLTTLSAIFQLYHGDQF